jgi:arsenite methyltransferase
MSQLVFDDDTAAAMEVFYRSRDVVRRRQLVQTALDAAPGDRILDVGCGPGFYVTELLPTVGAEGSVTGVDSSPQMLAVAAQRSAGHPNAKFLEGDATSLPVDDAAFDAAFSVQVLEYVADIPAALAELHRVVRPGGRVVVWDTDWATLSWHSTDAARTERLLRAWDEHLTHKSLPRTLATQLRAAGFADVRTDGHAFVSTEDDPDSYGTAIMPLIVGYVSERQDLAAGDVEGWVADQRHLGQRGEFFVACVQFCFTATRPS